MKDLTSPSVVHSYSHAPRAAVLPPIWDAELLGALADATKDLLWVVDSEALELVWWNRAIAEFLGKRGVTLHPGQSMEDAHLGGMDAPQLEALYRDALAEGAVSVETQLGPSAWLALDLVTLVRDGEAYAILVTARDITARRRVELEKEDALRRLAEEQNLLRLREGEQQLLLRNAPAAIFEVDLTDYRFVAVNDYVLDVTGYTREELLALGPLDLLDGPSGERIRQALPDLATGNELSDDTEYIAIKKDGSRISFVMAAGPIFENGKPVRALVVGHDITPQRLAHERMLRAEEKYHAVVDNIHEGLVIISRDDTLLYANEMACRAIERTIEECLAEPFIVHLHPDDRAAALEAGRRIFETGENLGEQEFRLIGKSGRILWVSVHSSLIDWDGQPALAVLLNDVTERELAAEQLERSERRYRTVVDNLQEGVIVATRDEKLYSNSRMAEMMGYTPEDYARVPFLARVHPDDLPVVHRQLAAAFDEGETETRFDFRTVDKAGQMKQFRCRASVTDWFGQKAVIGCMDDVTVEVQAETAIRQSAEIIDTMFRFIQDGVYMTAVEDGCLFELNRSFEQMFGIVHHRAVGHTTTELGLWADPEDRGRFAGTLQRRGFIQDFGMVARRRNGETFPAAMSAATVEIDGKQCIVGTIRDETERARAQRALVESEARYRLLADNIADVIWMADPESLRFTYISPSCRYLDGYEPDELIGTSILDRIVPAARPARIAHLTTMLKAFLADGGQFVDFESEAEVQRKDGSTLWSEVRTRFFRDPSTGRPAIIGLTRDKSKQKAAEDALREKQEQLDRFFSLEVGLLSITDLEGRFKLVSAGWETTLGQPAAALLERSFFDFLHPEDLGLVRDAISKLSCQTEPVDFVARVLAPDGSHRTIAWRAAPAGELVYAAARDITDLVAAEERLRQSQKMEAIGQLAGGIAHDFNNLLTAILGYSDLLLASPRGQEEGMIEDLLEIKGAAKRAAELTQQILAFSRKQALHPEVICLDHVLAETKPLMERLLGEAVTLEVCTQEGLGLCEIDPIQFTQVLINLIINARDAMPQGGVLILETANAEVGKRTPPPALADLGPGRYVVLRCSDTGTGMDDATTSRIFEPFFTTKNCGQGTGLGLSTVHGIVHQSGGTVLVQSEVGQGTVFTIYLPRVTGAESHPSERDEKAGGAQGHGSILVVEDEGAVGALVRRVLEARGYRVLCTKDAVEALAILSDPEEQLDVLVTDMILPGGMHGGALADAAKSMRNELEVIYMSGYSRDFNIHGGRLDASVRFLQKPFTSNSLVAKVEEALAGRKGKGQEQR